MLFRLLTSLGLAFAVISCGKADKKPIFPPITANQSCADVALFRDMALSGKYLKSFFNCAAVSDQGSTKLPNTLKLINDLDEAGIDRLLEFLLQPAPAPLNHQGAYPYLNLFAVLLDRGNTSKPSEQGYATLADRYDTLQPFLKEFDPYRSALLVLDWQATQVGSGTQLDRMLDHLLDALKRLPDGSIKALTHDVLNREDLRKALVEASVALLGEDAFYAEVETFMTLDRTHPLEPGDRNFCLSKFVSPAPRGDDGTAYKDCRWQTTAASLTGYDRFQLVKDEVGAEQLRKVLDEALTTYLATDNEVRLRRTEALLKGVRNFVDTQANPLETANYLAQFLISTKIKDLKFLFDESGILGQLLGTAENESIISLKVIGTKIGYGALHDELTRWLIEGDTDERNYCGNFRWRRGLQDIVLHAQSWIEVAQAINTVLSPNADCQRGLSPLVGKAMSLGECADSCFSELTADALQQAKIVPADADPVDLANLVAVAFARAEQETHANKYYLYEQGLALGAVTGEQLAAVREDLNKLIAEDGLSIATLAKYSATLDTVKGVEPKRFADDFIERLLQQTIDAAQRVAYEHGHDFDVSEPKKAQWAINRLAYGIYEGGPLDDILKAEITPEKFPELQGVKDYAAWGLLAKYRSVDSMFQNSIYLDGVESFRFAGADTSLRDSTLSRANLGVLTTTKATGAFSRNFEKLKILKTNDLVNWDSHPLKADSRRFDRKPIADLVRNLGTPLGSEGWDQRLLDTDCSGNPNCPSESMTRALNQTLADGSNLWLLMKPEAALSPEQNRLLLFYLARHFGLPMVAPAANIAATADVTSRQVNDKYNNNFIDLESFEDYPWPSLLEYRPSGLATSTSLSDITSSDRFANFRAEFYGTGQSLDRRQDYPENLRLLAGMGLLVTSGKRPNYVYAPMIGFQAEGESPVCLLNNKFAACPLTLKADGGLPAAEAYRHLIGDLYAAQLCPFLDDATDLGSSLPQLSATQKALLRAKTGWTDTSICARPSLKQIYEESRQAFQDDRENQIGLPGGFIARIFNDINILGIKPQIRSGLASVGFAVHFTKIKQGPRVRARDVLAFAPGLTPESAAWRKAFANDAVVLPYRPSVIDAYLATVASILPNGNWDRDTWMKLFKPTIDLSDEAFRKTTLIRYLQERLKNANRDPRRGELSLLEFSLEELAYLNSENPLAAKQRSNLAQLFATPSSHRAMEVLAVLNSAVDPGFKATFPNGGPQDWRTEKTFEMIKLLGRPEIISPFMAGIGQFDGAEFVEGMEFAGRLAQALGPDAASQARRLTVMIRAAQMSFFAIADESGVSRFFEDWQSNLTNLIRLLPERIKSFDGLAGLLTKPITDFDGKTIPGPLALDQNTKTELLDFAVQRFPDVVRDYQSSAQAEPQFLRELLAGLIKPLLSDENRVYFSFDQFLRQPIFGLTGDQPFIFEPFLGEKRHRLASLLGTLNQSNAETWLGTIKESKDLMRDSFRFIEFAADKMQFTEQKEAIDYKRALQAMRTLSKPEDDGLMLNKQIELVDDWFHKQDNIDSLASVYARMGKN